MGKKENIRRHNVQEPISVSLSAEAFTVHGTMYSFGKGLGMDGKLDFYHNMLQKYRKL